MIWQILFWFPWFLVLYTYLIYPEWMRKKARKYQSVEADPTEWPSIDLLIAAYNEEDCLADKIRTCLDTRYPGDRIRLVIGSDCSSDRTDEIVQEWSRKDPRVQLVRFHERTGKPGIINRLAAESRAEILVLSDADTLFEPKTLTELIKPFTDACTGGVQANFISRTPGNTDVSRQELHYNRREAEIKKGQSVDGCVIGAFGACYALRRTAYRPVPEGFPVDDFYLFMKVLEEGYATVFAEKATCSLEISGESKTEFRRKLRIGTGNFLNFKALSAFHHPFRNRASFYYWSHKVLRWFTPFLLLWSLLILVVLAAVSPFYSSLLLVALSILALILMDLGLQRLGLRTGALRYFSHFFMMNIAMLGGFFRSLRGRTKGTW